MKERIQNKAKSILKTKYPMITFVVLLLVAGLSLLLFHATKEEQRKAFLEQEENALQIIAPQLNGEAFLLKNKNKAVLIDSGTTADANKILQIMRANGIDSLEALILTHFDKDHIGGAAFILNRVPVEKCYMTCGSADSQEYSALMEALYASDTEQYTVTDVNTFYEINARFIIYPPRTYYFEEDVDDNRSLIIKVAYEDRQLLFPGDSREERLKQYFGNQYHGTAFDFMVVPNHGRNHKSLEQFLEKFTPSHAVITSSQTQPANGLAEEDLTLAGSHVWYPLKGDISFYVTGDGIDACQGDEIYDHREDTDLEEEVTETTTATETTTTTEATTEATSEESEKVQVEQPTFSQESGFYSEAFSLTIDAPEGTTVYYNMNSATPSVNSTPYTGEILIEDNSSKPNVYCNYSSFWPYISYPAVKGEKQVIKGYYSRFEQTRSLIDKCVVVRAIAVDANGNTSQVKTATYFVGYDQKTGYENMAVMSLVSNPYGLFSSDAGIMVNGKTYETKVANGDFKGDNTTHEIREYTNSYTGRGRDWERAVHIDYFDENGKQLVFTQEAGIRLHGNESRVNSVQKSFNLYARKSYDGNSTFLTDFFGDGILTDRVTLMAGKNTRGYYLTDLMNNRTMDTQQYKLVQVFLDGEYWGMYAIQEKINSKKYVKTHYDLNDNEYLMFAGKSYEFQLKNGVEKTTLTSFQMLKSYVQEHDLSDPKEYARVCSMMDVQSYIDDYGARLYTADQDWSTWKNHYLMFYDNKWHWICYDMDYGTANHEDSLATDNTFLSTRVIANQTLAQDAFFPYLMANEQFRIDFINTMMDMANDVFNVRKIQKNKEEFLTKYKTAYQKNLKRYPALERMKEVGSEDFYVSDWNKIETFFKNRPYYFIKYMKEYFQFPGHLYDVRFSVNEQEGGKLKINTITPQLTDNSWAGQYFQECPITVTAIANQGWTFVGWESENITINQPKEKTITIRVGEGSTIRAIFSKK